MIHKTCWYPQNQISQKRLIETKLQYRNLSVVAHHNPLTVRMHLANAAAGQIAVLIAKEAWLCSATDAMFDQVRNI